MEKKLFWQHNIVPASSGKPFVIRIIVQQGIHKKQMQNETSRGIKLHIVCNQGKGYFVQSPDLADRVAGATVL